MLGTEFYFAVLTARRISRYRYDRVLCYGGKIESEKSDAVEYVQLLCLTNASAERKYSDFIV